MSQKGIQLLDREEYDRIIRENRAAEVLERFVKRGRGRPAENGEAKTNAQRQREFRDRQRQKREAERAAAETRAAQRAARRAGAAADTQRRTKKNAAR